MGEKIIKIRRGLNGFPYAAYSEKGIINREEVSEEEILSDSVYYYDREKKEIRVLEG